MMLKRPPQEAFFIPTYRGTTKVIHGSLVDAFAILWEIVRVIGRRFCGFLRVIGRRLAIQSLIPCGFPAPSCSYPVDLKITCRDRARACCG